MTQFSATNDLSLTHLKAELARIDVLIQYQIRCWQLAGQDPADTFRGLYVSDSEVQSLLARPLAGSWGQSIVLPEAETQAFAEAKGQSEQQLAVWLQKVEAEGETLRFRQLEAIFGLSRFELDVLLICLAPALDLRYERIYSYLQDDVTRKRPTINLVLDVLGPAGPDRLQYLACFAADAPLFAHNFLQRGGDDTSILSQTLTLDEAIVSWLLGQYQPPSDLGANARLLGPAMFSNKADQLLCGEAESQLVHISQMDTPPLLVFWGIDHLSQKAAARLLAAPANRSLLAVNMAAIIKAETAALRALRLSLRDARLTGAIPFLQGWDACLTKEGELPAVLLQELCAYPDLVIVAGQSLWQASGLKRERTILWLEFPSPAYTQRLALWSHFLEVAANQADFDLVALAGQFALTTGQIRDTVATAKDLAAQREQVLQEHDLFVAARNHSNPRLATLARKIVPRYEWDDIVLPPDQRSILEEIIATVQGRPQVLEQWGVGQKLASSAAVTVLFAGDPGTGKTMAAEVIAKALNLDLYKIDLSTMISKYIGETEKNLEKIFSEAESSNAILFFDEADAIFGKRSEVKDAHDRYANIEVSYLLQRMEAYDGVTILATNLRANLDEAFTRRLQFAIDFPFPEAEDRLHIWQTLFPPDVPQAPELDFTLFAKRFKLAGGNIRNIIINAAYQAAADGGRVTMEHLMHGTRRELQKMGRLVGEEDLRI